MYKVGPANYCLQHVTVSNTFLCQVVYKGWLPVLFSPTCPNLSTCDIYEQWMKVMFITNNITNCLFSVIEADVKLCLFSGIRQFSTGV